MADDAVSYSIVAEPSVEIRRVLVETSGAFNESKVGPSGDGTYAVIATDGAAELLGGILCRRFWGIFFVAAFFIEAEHRYRGIGRELLRHAELLARSIGCEVVYLDTSDFQAPDFYPKFGYRRFATLTIPQGFQRFWLYKRLEVIEPAAGKRPFALEVITDPGKDIVNWIIDRLIAFNESKAGPRNPQRYAILAFNPDGKRIGGLFSERIWKMFSVSHLHVEAPVRGRGIGRELMVHAEALAGQVGSTTVFLDTFEFQAPEFYRKCGYRQIGQLDVPAGFKRFWFAKQLVVGAAGVDSAN
jgi:GNAT superfamily N-acetyltransferase